MNLYKLLEILAYGLKDQGILYNFCFRLFSPNTLLFSEKRVKNTGVSAFRLAEVAAWFWWRSGLERLSSNRRVACSIPGHGECFSLHSRLVMKYGRIKVIMRTHYNDFFTLVYLNKLFTF